MAEPQDVNNLAAVQAQVSAQQSAIAARQAEAQQSQLQLQRQVEAMNTQQALRVRDLQAKQVADINMQNINAARLNLSNYQESLNASKNELNLFETNVLKPAEQQQKIIDEQNRKIQEDQAAYKEALNWIRKGREYYGYNNLSSSLARSYAKQFLEDSNAIEELQSKVNAVNTGTTTLNKVFTPQQLEFFNKQGLIQTEFKQEIPQTKFSGYVSPTIVKVQPIKSSATPLNVAYDVLFGNTGKSIVGINLPAPIGVNAPPLTGHTIPAANIQEVLRKVQDIKTPIFTTIGFSNPAPIGINFQPFSNSISMFPVRTAAALIPTTPADVAIAAGTPATLTLTPPVVRIAAGGLFTYLGARTALNSDLPQEERTAAAVIGGLGAVGAASEIYPFISGSLARLNPRYSPVVESTFEGKPVTLIQNVKLPSGTNENIFLIPEGNRRTGNTPAFISTAYGFSKGEQAAYINKVVKASTSARSLIDSSEGVVVINPGQEGYGLFFTPEDLTTGNIQTRMSRLGIKTVKDLFKFPGTSSEITFKSQKPQIVILGNELVTKEGTPGTLKAFGKPSTELEVTALGKLINIKKSGTTAIDNTKVDIFSAELEKPTEFDLFNLANTNKQTSQPSLSSDVDVNYVSPSGTVSSALSLRNNFRSFGTSFNPKTNYTSITSKQPSGDTSSLINLKYNPPSSPPGRTSTKLIDTISIPNFSIPNKPSITPPLLKSPPGPTPKRRDASSGSILIPPKSYDSFKSKLQNLLNKKKKIYDVFVRRKGKFFRIAKGLPEGKAFKAGTSRTLTDLSRTFKLKETGLADVEDINFKPSEKLFRAPKNKEPLTFVQRQALNKGSGEVPEILSFKKLKSKKTKFKLF